jgi:aerobic-type carbon monoxide dehydrogenase small subunit (CoxS/CutS family)
MLLKFDLNGKSQSVDVPEDMPLLWVLRDTLQQKELSLGVEKACVAPAQFISMAMLFARAQYLFLKFKIKK